MNHQTPQPQTNQARVLHVCQRAARTRTPEITPCEALAAYQREFGGRFTLNDIKVHIQALVDLGQLERVGHRTCTMKHTRAPMVRVPAALAVLA